MPQTTVHWDANFDGGRGCTLIRRTADGYTCRLYDVGRCWRLAHGPSDDSTTHYVDIAHVHGDPFGTRLVRRIRRWLREDALPVLDVHVPALR